ncbi:MAG TPA: GNAT family N-acetyltransferase [Candidatus Sulfomarinibacteraceae bacterium]|nr:GNAT family N-acetyltransferase [Candidatus Sulfomarinibacteraceae bacterium]
MTDEYVIESLSPQAFLALREALVAVYRAAFLPPPYEKTEGAMQQFANALARHVRQEGFRAFVAREGQAGEVVGLAYGYTSRQGQWWHDHVSRALGREKAAYWLGDAFELVELAVSPERQGLGLGGRLHDALLGEATQRTAVLSTLDAETAGFHLYRRRGWQVLLRDFHFPGVQRRYQIMGREL